MTCVNPRWAAWLAVALFTTPWRGNLRRSYRGLLLRAQSEQLDHRSFRIRVFTWEGSGPTVVLVHGWSSRALRLAFLIEQLRAAGFRVIAFDAPGHGASRRMRSNIWLFCEALRAVIERAGRVDAVVGHSFGARAAMLLLKAAGAPQVRALGVMAMPPDVRYVLEEFKVVLGLDAAVSDLLEEQIELVTGEPDIHSPDDVTRLRLPVIVLHDEDDDIAPVQHARRLARQLPRGHLHVTRALNHCGLLTDPGAIGELVKFLALHCEDRKCVAQTGQGSGGDQRATKVTSGLPASLAVESTH